MAKATLLDLAGAEAPASVTVRGLDMSVPGLPAGAIARLLRQLPEFEAIFEKMKKEQASVMDVMQAIPDAEIGVLIASGLGYYNKPEMDQMAGVANALPLEEQIDILAAIFAATMPGGIGPFVGRLKARAKGLGIDFDQLMVSPTN